MNRFLRRPLALALVCCGLLMMEVCLTKIFSIVLWYHFGFLAVSTALLGFASSGVYLALKPSLPKGADSDVPIAHSAAVASVATVAALWLVTQTTFDVYSVIADRTIGTLLAFVLWVTLPFFFLGLVISRTLAAFPERVNLLYGSDLIGSAAGCGLAVLVLSAGYSGQTAILLAAVLCGAGGALFAGPRPRALAVALCGAAVPLGALLLLDPGSAFPLKSPASKPYYRVESIDKEMKARGMPLWRRGLLTMKDGSVLEVETTSPPDVTADGKSVRAWTDDGPRTIALDDIAEKPDGEGLAFREESWSPYRQWSSLSRVDAFHWPQAYGAWGLWGISEHFKRDPDVVLPRQKGITIDAWAMTSIMHYSGAPLWPPGDPATVAERKKLKVLEYLPAGTVHRVKQDIDDIMCIGAGGGLDLLTAKYFGAKHITGVEINPGVVEAVREGFPEFSGRLYDPAHNPDVEVHVAEGRHFLESTDRRFDVVQLSGVDTFSTTQAGAFSLAENYLYTVEAFETFMRKLKPGGVLTLTRWFYPNVRNGVLEPRASLRLLALAREALARSGHRDPRESVFFLNSNIFTVILIAPDGFTTEQADALRQHCAKYGFEVLYSPYAPTPEITVAGEQYPNPLQAFMASDEPDGFLAAQRFDVTPPCDDRPFFFEVSRFSRVFDLDQLLNPLGGLTGHGILMLLFAEVLLLGLLFVILPLQKLRQRDNTPRAGRVRLGTLLYFTAIGFGFIVVEIVLSQKFVLFLGHPMYALVVILFSVLLFSGIGALLSNRFPWPRYACIVVAVLALAPALLFQPVFEHCLAFPLAIRIAISVLLLAPVALAMGVPFPVGISMLARSRPALIPWAWGINGYTSVLGSVAAVILGIELGFMMTLFLAALVYCLGVGGYALMHADAGPDPLPAPDPFELDGEPAPENGAPVEA